MGVTGLGEGPGALGEVPEVVGEGPGAGAWVIVGTGRGEGGLEETPGMVHFHPWDRICGSLWVSGITLLWIEISGGSLRDKVSGSLEVGDLSLPPTDIGIDPFWNSILVLEFDSDSPLPGCAP
jgi:hypothetical protein